MKTHKLIWAAVLICTAQSLFSQTTSSQKERPLVGFVVGVNYANIELENGSDLPYNASYEGGVGVDLGILAEFKIAKGLYVSPAAYLIFNNTDMEFEQNDHTKTVYEIMPVSLGMNGDLKYRFGNGKSQPYALLGASYKIPINETEGTNEFPTENNFSLNIGFGLHNQFEVFDFAPELVYSHGFSDVNANPALKTLYHHQLSLRFKFLG